MNNPQESRIWIRKILSFLQLILLLIIVIGIPLYIWFYRQDLIESINSLEKAEAYLRNYRTESYWIYLAVQVVQIVISIIPGQFMNMAAGYLFQFPVAFALSVGGAAIGTFFTYGIAILLGKRAVKTLFEPNRYNRFLRRFNSKKAYMTVFILYLVPGLPKDVLGYIAGVSSMKFFPFLVISIAGRIPALAVSCMVGSMLHKEIYTGVILLVILMLIITIVGIINRKKLLRYIDSGYNKYIVKEGSLNG